MLSYLGLSKKIDFASFCTFIFLTGSSNLCGHVAWGVLLMFFAFSRACCFRKNFFWVMPSFFSQRCHGCLSRCAYSSLVWTQHWLQYRVALVNYKMKTTRNTYQRYILMVRAISLRWFFYETRACCCYEDCGDIGDFSFFRRRVRKLILYCAKYLKNIVFLIGKRKTFLYKQLHKKSLWKNAICTLKKKVDFSKRPHLW